jgi:hypothetical protein
MELMRIIINGNLTKKQFIQNYEGILDLEKKDDRRPI